MGDTAFAPKWPKGEMIRFLNEVESGPTLYLDARFKHPVNWISFMCQKCVETAYEVTGIPKPETVEEMKKMVDRGMLEGHSKAKKITAKQAVVKKSATKKPAKKESTKKVVST